MDFSDAQTVDFPEDDGGSDFDFEAHFANFDSYFADPANVVTITLENA